MRKRLEDHNAPSVSTILGDISRGDTIRGISAVRDDGLMLSLK
ncbi:MAG TPA: hypothetical protein VEC43_03010 [Candidatus Acidoferrales bacterium]|nr:hypothetical protein [Candidatus Acidoferrales bacterium]